MIIDQLKALGEDNRFRIAMMLLSRPLCVCEIHHLLNISGATLSNHLKILKYSGIVKSRREGKWIEYDVKDDAIRELLTDIRKRVDDDSIISNDAQELKTISRDLCKTG